jgi:multiple sugar transport system substrate-binding protein
VTVTFGVYDFVRGNYAPLVEQFNAEHPDVQVQLVSLNGVMDGDSELPWDRRLAAAADSFAIWSGSPAGVEQGYLYDLGPLIAADSSLNVGDFYPNAIEADTQGRVGLLPTSLQLPLLMYNRDLFAERGVPTPTAEWSWADLRAAAEGIAQRDGETIATYGLMLSTRADLVGTGALHSLGPLIQGQDTAQVDLASPPFIAAVEEIVELVRDGVVYTPPEYPDGSFLYSSDYMPLIEGGRIGMWMSDVVQGSDAAGVQFATGIAPVPPDESQWRGMYREGVAISAGTQHPEAAWRWISFLSQQDLVANAGRGPETIPARRSLLELNTRYQELDEAGRAAVAEALEQLATNPRPDNSRRNSAFWQLPNAVTEAVKAVLDNDETPEAALAAAQSTLDEALAAASATTPTPAATPEPVVVATPQPVVAANPDAISFTFVTTEDVGPLRELAAQFNEQFPQFFVQVEPFSWPQDGTPVGIDTIAESAPCFQAWGPPTEENSAALLDLQPLIDADQSFPRDDLPPLLLAPYQRDGQSFGLPRSVTFRTLMYNPELFDAAGLAYPSADWIVDDFAAAAQALTTAEGDTGAYGFVPQGGWDMLVYLRMVGAPLVRGEGDGAVPDYGNPELAAAIQAYFALLRAASPTTAVSGYARDDNSDNAYTLVEGGRVAMAFAYGFDSYGGGAIERAFAPLPGSGRVDVIDFFSSGLYIAADAPSPEACYAWLRFLMDSSAGLVDGFPARVSLAESPEFLERAPAGAAELYAAARPELLAPNLGTSRSSLDSTQIDSYWLLRAADRAFQGGDLTQELTEAQFLTEQFLACVRSGETPGACAKQVDPTYDGWAE